MADVVLKFTIYGYVGRDHFTLIFISMRKGKIARKPPTFITEILLKRA